MAGDASNPLLRHIRRLIGLPEDGPETDGQLLEWFVARRDEAAFEALLSRHGPMVLGTCRRILRDQHDVEDAFQAAFLVLCRKAGSIGSRAAVGGWLHQVACRVALKLKAEAARRPVLDNSVDRPATDNSSEVIWRDLRPILDEELSRLPEKFRSPLVLHYLEGKTVAQTAQLLGCPQGTILSRLDRARERLRTRLTRRGLTLSAATFATALAQQATAGPLPALLAKSTSKMAALFALSQAAVPGDVAPKAAALAKGVLHAMLLTKIKVATIVLVTVGAMGVGSGVVMNGVLARRQAAAEEAGLAEPPGKTDQPVADGRKPAAAKTDRYGDPLPEGAVARMGTVRLRGAGPLEFTPDGKTLISTAGDSVQSLFFWNVATGRKLRSIKSRDYWLSEFTLSADGKFIATPQHTGKIGVWDVNTGTLLRELDTAGIQFPSFGKAVFSADAKLVAVGTQSQPQTIGVWDQTNGKMVHQIQEPQDHVQSYCLLPDNKTLILAHGSGTLAYWDLTTGKLLRRIAGDRFEAKKLALTRDGKILVIMGNRTVWVRNAATGELIHKLVGTKGLLLDAVVSADGTIAASSAESEPIRIWDVASGKELRKTEAILPPKPAYFQGYARGLAFSPDGKVLASTHLDPTIRLWDVATGKRIPRTHGGHADGLQDNSIAFSPDGKQLVSGSFHEDDYGLRVWDVASGEQVKTLEGQQGYTRGLVFTPDGRLISGSGDGSIRIWNVNAGNEQRRLVIRTNPSNNVEGQVSSLTLARDGKKLASVSVTPERRDNDEIDVHRFTIWDVDTGKQLLDRRENDVPEFRSHPTYSISSDMKSMVRWANDIRLQSLANNRRIVPLRTSTAVTQYVKAAFSPDGKTLAALSYHSKGDINGTGTPRYALQLWDVVSGKEIRSIPLSEDSTSSIAFSSDGRMLAVAGPNAVRLWHLATFEDLRNFDGHESRVNCLAFSPDGTRLAAAQADTTVLVWDVSSAGKRAAMEEKKLTSAEPVRLWDDLASDDAVVACAAIWRLKLSPSSAMPILRDRLRPDRSANLKAVQELIAGLDSNQFAVREKARKELKNLAELAEPALRQTLAGNPSLEVRKEIDSVLDNLGGPISNPEKLRQLRAVEVLEHLATSAARDLLKILSQGAPEARLTQEAKASLDRLAKRPQSGDQNLRRE